MCVVLRDTQMTVGVHHKNLFMLSPNMRDLFFPDCGKNPLSRFCFMCFSHLSCKQVYHLVMWHSFVSKSHLNCKKSILYQCSSYPGNSAFCFFFAKCQWHFVFSHVCHCVFPHVVRCGYAYPLLKFAL